MRILIVDDEPAARRRLAIMLSELDVEVVGEAENGVDALAKVRERRPDLILLDIAMPEVDGFDVARHLPEPKPLIIFQTAYEEHALKAFEHDALDYVVKPVTLVRLEQALERARRRLTATSLPALTPSLLAQLQQSVGERPASGKPRLLVREGASLRLVPLREVVRFRAEEGAVYALTASARYPTDYTLQELESRTTGSFVRPNRSTLLNLDFVQTIRSNGDGSASITLSDGTKVHVSRRRAGELRRMLEG